MHDITATFRNGQLELSQPVDWPDGMRVKVVPLLTGSAIDEAHAGTEVPTTMTRWPDGFLDEIREQLGDGPLERPPQGEFEQREDW